mgnify:CR=1 FL=1
MLINRANLSTLFNALNAAFNKGFTGADNVYTKVAMVVPSSASSETYGWLGTFPKMREWIGDRQIQNLAAATYAIQNRKFENTVSVGRTDIEDDRYGVFSPIMAEMGKSAAEHPNELVFSLLAEGFTSKCYDGQYFFDSDHPVTDASGANASVSNTGGGSGTPWFLLDISRAIKPLVFQERLPYKLTALTEDNDENVFWKDEYIYGVRARSNAGFGLWQLAYGSKQTLDAASYAAARAAMQNMRGDGGRPLGIKPTLLVVPPSLESAGLKLLNSELATGGETNEWKGTAELLVTPWAG